MTIVRLHRGDALELVSRLADASVDAVVTSPPYFRQRDYSDDPRQLGGREAELTEYVDYLVALFRALLPKLTRHAAIWLNLRARFAGGGFGVPGPRLRPRQAWKGITGHAQRPPAGFRERDLVPVPALVADALRHRTSLILRAEIVWSKTAAVEAPRQDRPSRSRELLYLFTPNHPCRARDPGEAWWHSTVWHVAVERQVREHPAAMPLELARRCLVGSDHPNLVLDPFCGSGTTLLAAARLGIDAVGFDLEPGYLALAQRRLVTDNPLAAPVLVTDNRTCAMCPNPLLGRADRLTCSDRCRQRFARRRSAHPDLLEWALPGKPAAMSLAEETPE